MILYLVTFFSSLWITPSAQITSQQSNSMVMHYSTGNIVQYQIDENGIMERWTIGSDINYNRIRITDLDNDGDQEIIMISPNEGLRVLSMQTGEEVWSYSYSAGNYQYRQVKIGDITGNGQSEIIFARSSPSVDIVYTDVFDARGNLIQQIAPYIGNGDRFSGADEVGLQDFDQDGISEVVIMYGAVLWDYNHSQGQLALQRYDWNSETNQLEEEFETVIDDTGGATRLRLLPDRIITAGWYNSPIRGFDSKGNLVWSQKIYQTDSKLNIADTQMEIIEDDNKYRLIATSTNYWSNLTMKIVDLDPISGVLYNSLNTSNHSETKIGILDNTVYISTLNARNNEGSHSSYYQVSSYQIVDGELVIREINSEENGWDSILRSDKLEMVLIREVVYFVISDMMGNWMYGTDGEKLPFSPSKEGLRAYTISQVEIRYNDGNYVDEYDLETHYGRYVSIIAIVLLLGGGLYFIKRRYEELQFDQSFGVNWQEHFKLKFDQFQKERVNTLDEAERHLLSPISIHTEKHKSRLARQGNAENLKEDLRSKYNLISSTKKYTIYDLLNTETEVAKQIKIGDMGILIEILSSYPESTEIVTLAPKFRHVTKSTLYKRIDKMIDLGLLKNIDESELFLNNRSRSIQLTELGLQLLAITYTSLDQKKL